MHVQDGKVQMLVLFYRADIVTSCFGMNNSMFYQSLHQNAFKK